MSTENFYRDLPALSRFAELTNVAHYQSLPEDWVIAVADIKNSTAAIAGGKYRAVNSLGVAVITAILNRTKPTMIPFVFGGDGASLCIPGSFVEEVRSALFSVKAFAQEYYQLDLRVGLVPVRDLAAAGKKALVAKYRISEYCTQASFTGGGLRFAENAIKNPDSGYEIKEQGQLAEADFYGFECRWQEFNNPEKATAAILVQAAEGADPAEIYGSVLRKIEEYYGSFDECHPLKIRSMNMSLNAEKLKAEFNIRTFGKERRTKIAYWIIMRIQILIGMFCMKYNIRFGEIEWATYKQQAIKNADIKKFDDMLRLVIAGGPAQCKQLENYLEERRRAGDLFYGICVSSAAIMTCYVVNYATEHYHFVDGSQGGYSLAAEAMKKQIREKKHSGFHN